MENVCKKCKTELSTNDTTIFGKQYKHCGQCREYFHNHKYKYAYYKDKYRQQHQQQQKTPEYKSYQYKYYRLRRSGLINYYRDKTIETTHTYSEKDFTVCM
jgi:hypothetical protein